MKKLLTASTLTAKVAIVVAAALGGTALVSSSVFASLTATASNAAGSGSVNSGTLKLTQAASGVTGITGGFTTAVTAMAPGDTVNRYIDLINGGTLDGSALTLGLAASPATALTTDGINGLKITVNQCSVAWTNTGTCSGTTTPNVLASASALSLATPATLSMASGSLLAASVNHLQISIALPAGSEVVANGVLPTGTVQGLTTALTWTFTEALRTNTTINS